MKIRKFNQLKFSETTVPAGKQAIINFGTYELSVVKNESSYGNKQGLYEIGVFKDNNMVELPGITAEGDTVRGYMTEEDVMGVILKLYMASAQEPSQLQGQSTNNE